MQPEKLWDYLRVGLLSAALTAALAVGLFAPPSLSPFEPAPIVQAGEGGDEDDEEDREDEDDEDDDGDAEAEGREVRGQVVGIRNPQTGTWAKASDTFFDESIPDGTGGLWQLRIGQLGGIVPVVVYNPDEIGRNGVSMGDHISVDGEFMGGTFYGTDIEVEDQF